MKQLFLIIGLIMALPIYSEVQLDRRRLVINQTDGSRQVYNLAELSPITFDKVDPIVPEIEVVNAKGFSAEIQVTIPETSSLFKVSVAPADVEIADWEEYILGNTVASGRSSGKVEIGGLTENTEYVAGVLAYDKYEMPCGIATCGFATVQADASEQPQIGYILYADGSWSRRRQNGKTPIGIIFSTETSDADKAAGYTHGYALALRNAADQIAWTPTPAALQTDFYASSEPYGFQTDMNGLTHTQVLESKGIDKFPAARAALEYDVPIPLNSSGWYLPSSGQWFEICVNLGGLSREMPRLGETEGYWNGLQDCSNSLQRINDYLSLSGSGNYEKINVPAGDYQWFWTSSEMSSEQAYVLFFDNDQLVVELAGYFKNYAFASNRVRAVIAF